LSGNEREGGKRYISAFAKKGKRKRNPADHLPGYAMFLHGGIRDRRTAEAYRRRGILLPLRSGRKRNIRKPLPDLGDRSGSPVLCAVGVRGILHTGCPGRDG